MISSWRLFMANCELDSCWGKLGVSEYAFLNHHQNLGECFHKILVVDSVDTPGWRQRLLCVAGTWLELQICCIYGCVSVIWSQASPALCLWITSFMWYMISLHSHCLSRLFLSKINSGCNLSVHPRPAGFFVRRYPRICQFQFLWISIHKMDAAVPARTN